MISINEVEEKLHKEEETLQDLFIKRDKLNEKITKKQEKIKELETMIERHKYSEISMGLQETNISLEELMIALKTGTLDELQNKINHNQPQNQEEENTEEKNHTNYNEYHD